jgi:hypothetical protein
LFSFFFSAEADMDTKTTEKNTKTDAAGNKYGPNMARTWTKKQKLSELKNP